MQIVYIDDSYDPPTYTFSAITIREDRWKSVLEAIRAFRQGLKQSEGIYVRKEFHATEFVAGRGEIADRTISKWRRCEIFKELLALIASQQGVNLFNVVLNRKDWAMERLLNRINRALTEWNDRAILVFDEGNEGEFTKLVRRLGAFNPIPSQFGRWSETGTQFKSIKIDRILEDPFFRESFRSYLIQAVDFCAFALLQRERPIPSRVRYGLDKAFHLLEPICVKAANPKDSYGIIR